MDAKRLDELEAKAKQNQVTGALPICVSPSELLALIAEVRRLREALPKTADGVPIVPGMRVWVWCPGDPEVAERVAHMVSPKRIDYPETVDGVVGAKATVCYSTREAAEAAKAK